MLNKFDKVATSPVWGKIIAACVMILSIYASYKLGYTLSNLSGIIYGYAYSAAYTGLSAISAPAFLIGFLCDAVLTGFFYAIMMTFFVLGAILIFGFIEEIGYMARIAYVFDNTMQKLGLHGKAIMPILMSFGCTIAGVNATRVLDSGKQKLLSIITSWVVPCSAVWGVITLLPKKAEPISVSLSMVTSCEKDTCLFIILEITVTMLRLTLMYYTDFISFMENPQNDELIIIT